MELDHTKASKEARIITRGRLAAATLLAFLVVAWLYLPLPNMPGRSADGAQRHVFSGDVEHVFYERGTGPVVVLLPSLGRPASDFNELSAALADSGFRTIAIDLNVSRKPSDGAEANLLSLAESVDAVITSLDLPRTEQVTMVGHAFGNRLARAYASTHTNKVGSVVLLAAGGRIPIDDDVKESLGDCFNPRLTRFARSQALRHAFFASSTKIPLYWRTGWDKSLAMIQIKATRTTPFDDWWDSGGVPLLIIQGDEDAIAPAAHTSELLSAEFGGRVRVAIASPAGHALLPEQPVFIANAIIEYLNEVN